jgi:hypothetical protein
MDLVHKMANRAALRSMVPEDRIRPELTGVWAHRCYRGSELDAGGPKGGVLLEDSDREVGWRRGARDLVGNEMIKRRWNELQWGGTGRHGGLELGVR